MPGAPDRQAVAEERQFYRIREKVVQHLKDFWRPYHGSTRHHEDRDGMMMVENRDLSGGSWPLNAAVMRLWGNSTLAESTRLFGRELYALAMDPRNGMVFGELQDLFGRYGAGDSDYDVLREGAAREREIGRSMVLDEEDAEPPEIKDSDRMFPAQMARYRAATGARPPGTAKVCQAGLHMRLLLVDRGIDAITEALIDNGVGDRDFWADFGLAGVPTTKTLTKEERYRTYYLYFLERCDELRQDRKRYRNRAIQETAERFEVSKRTVEEAVYQVESGYVDLEAS